MMREEELNQYWKTVVDTIAEGVMIVAPGGIIVAANRALLQLLGYELAELIGQPCSILNCTACHLERQREPEHWCRLFRDGSLRKQRCVLTRRDGSRLHIFKNASVLRDSAGKVLGAVETMTDITELLAQENRIEAYKRELTGRDTFHGMVGISAAMQQVYTMVDNAADAEAPIIIYGESGTGKELVAQAIHERSSRRDFPYIKVNCAALNESLLESELFGHVKGAFTSAIQDRKGRFEAAEGGTIFLDEIGDLPLVIQVKLLRVLEEKIIERVGDNLPVPINVRIVTATNKDLMAMVREGSFREDFFYRINVIPIHIPAVRERSGDIPLLAETFFRQLQLKMDKNIRGISRQAMDLLLRYPWPGNVRELENKIKRAIVMAETPIIEPWDLGFEEREAFGADEMQVEDNLPVNGFVLEGMTLKEARYRVDHELLQQVMEKCQGNVQKAAELLAVSRPTFYDLLKKHGLHTN